GVAQDANDIPRLRREKREAVVARRRREVQDWEAVVRDKRDDAIQQRIDGANTAALDAIGAVHSLYLENAAIASEEKTVRTLTAIARAQVQEATSTASDLQKRWTQLKEREARAAGSTA